ncbi:hypothetical protein Lalb_Chr19g0131411 [Lupinus albus]|uniref:Uncharacterized protein n=1 Tax=Lupinus albus TaxID=3870 RepID=A0A6A4NT94_LUPAL|nr:hypothetical protein Lalb_Chr19g0131411 [Lupinus albus]
MVSTTRSASSTRLSLQRRLTRESNALLRVKPGLRFKRIGMRSSREEVLITESVEVAGVSGGGSEFVVVGEGWVVREGFGGGLGGEVAEGGGENREGIKGFIVLFWEK